MDDSGRIYTPAQVEAAIAANKSIAKALVPIEDDELAKVTAMNRRDRRAWYAEKRRQMRRAAKKGPTDAG